VGDAVRAVWGTPVASEEDAERAVRAALDLVTAVGDLGAESGVPGLAARAGVVTGEVAVTLGAMHEGMVAGDAVNTASRVQAASDPGCVLVDEATCRLTARAVGCADGGEHLLKGKAEPKKLWRATRVVSALGGAQRVDGLEGPLVGRDAELRTIKELFHASADRRGARVGGGFRAGGGGEWRRGGGGWECAHRRRGWGGSLRSTPTGWRGNCGGTGADACRMGRGWRSGRWRRSCGSGWASPRMTPRQLLPGSWPTAWTGMCPIRGSGPTSACAWAG